MTNESARQPPIGIDLGTTCSVVAYLDAAGRPITLHNRLGDLITPSAVLIEGGEIIVGKEALKSSAVNPAGYADCFKRDMGRPTFHRPVLEQDVLPEVFSAFLLEQLKKDAEDRLGPIRQVVITVPAFFDENRRKATQDAARLANLDPLDIINEPTAAAVAFGHHHKSVHDAMPGCRPERLLVYDLGGGTFDVTILEVDGETFRTVATDGDVQLGGKDFDERLVNYVAESFIALHGLDPRSDARDAAQLWLDVQDVKHTLSSRSKAMLVCFHAGIRMKMEITRGQFEELSRDLLERTESTTDLVMKQAKLQWEQVDRLLLVGGSTRMPMVGEMLRRLTGKEPDRSQSADEVVACGAAIYAGMLMEKGTSPEAQKQRLINVNSHSLGIVGIDTRTGQQVNAILIPKNTPLPYHKVRKCKTARPNQRTVKVAAVEGESPRPEHCTQLGYCVIRDLPPGLPAGTRVEVEYRYASNGRISVRARVPSVRQSAQVEIQRDTERELGTLDAWRKRLTSGTPGDDPTHEPTDRAFRIKRLDALHTQAGAVALKGPVPPNLQRSHRAALAAAQELERARTELAHAEALRQSAASPAEAATLSAKAAQARLAVQHAQTNADFATLVLGRECLAANFILPEMQVLLPEIQKLRDALATST
ncbi:MAG: Hsp70 family protein [Thermoguttaceae bacterium]|jgi:molecular chaperone DnaK|nr:Hsp70 family protein [Thermoguttaceae bacterium]